MICRSAGLVVTEAGEYLDTFCEGLLTCASSHSMTAEAVMCGVRGNEKNDTPTMY